MWNTSSFSQLTDEMIHTSRFPFSISVDMIRSLIRSLIWSVIRFVIRSGPIQILSTTANPVGVFIYCAELWRDSCNTELEQSDAKFNYSY